MNSNKSSLSSSTRKTKFLVRRNSAKKITLRKKGKKNKERENAANKQPYLVILVILSLLFIHKNLLLYV